MIYFILCCFHSKDHPSSQNWTLDFEPAFSPRFSPTLSPRSFFHTRQRFPFPNHVTSGCMSPRSFFIHWSAVSPTGSSSGHVIALDQSEASICPQRAQLTTSVLSKHRTGYITFILCGEYGEVGGKYYDVIW